MTRSRKSNFADWSRVREVLGNPKTILCLGNGPSSESAEALRASFDCLFRVNWIWRLRAHHLAPDAVFTADLDLPPDDFKGLLVFPTRAVAERILDGYHEVRPERDDPFVVFWELPSPFAAQEWSSQPTNGALMIASAAMLRPQRIIIAGIDLYLHPEGKYPGPANEPNAYDSGHDRLVDVAFIRLALGSFPGEVSIESEALKEHLGADFAGRGAPWRSTPPS